MEAELHRRQHWAEALTEIRHQFCRQCRQNLGPVLRALRRATVDRLPDEVARVYPKIMLDGAMDAGAWSCGMVAADP